jgi:hypothetical protein
MLARPAPPAPDEVTLGVIQGRRLGWPRLALPLGLGLGGRHSGSACGTSGDGGRGGGGGHREGSRQRGRGQGRGRRSGWTGAGTRGWSRRREGRTGHTGRTGSRLARLTRCLAQDGARRRAGRPHRARHLQPPRHRPRLVGQRPRLTLPAAPQDDGQAKGPGPRKEEARAVPLTSTRRGLDGRGSTTAGVGAGRERGRRAARPTTQRPTADGHVCHDAHWPRGPPRASPPRPRPHSPRPRRRRRRRHCRCCSGSSAACAAALDSGHPPKVALALGWRRGCWPACVAPRAGRD